MYRFVRDRLAVPFTQEKTLRTPEPELAGVDTDGIQTDRTGVVDAPNVGSLMTAVYQSMRTGALCVALMECLQEARLESKRIA
jgi:non-ribosomal peptide synthetase component E (peptide arylation enzyme)